jgi:hypothetical protein
MLNIESSSTISETGQDSRNRRTRGVADEGCDIYYFAPDLQVAKKDVDISYIRL